MRPPAPCITLENAHHRQVSPDFFLRCLPRIPLEECRSLRLIALAGVSKVALSPAAGRNLTGANNMSRAILFAVLVGPLWAALPAYASTDPDTRQGVASSPVANGIGTSPSRGIGTSPSPKGFGTSPSFTGAATSPLPKGLGSSPSFTGAATSPVNKGIGTSPSIVRSTKRSR